MVAGAQRFSASFGRANADIPRSSQGG
jgi:hypothetical protein